MKLNQCPKNKESQLHYIGKIPEHWDIVPLKRISKRIVVGIAEAATQSYVDQGTPLLRSANIKFGVIDTNDLLYITEDFAKKNSSKYLYSNDLLTVRTGNAGQTAVVPNSLNKSQCFTMLITTLKNNYNPRFYNYFLNSVSCTSYFDITAWGTAQKNISVPILKECPVPILPSTEQDMAVKYLDSQTSEINNAIKKSVRLIDFLDEKRNALINQAVIRGLDPESELKDSEIDWFGRIPKNWQIRKLKHIADVRISNIDKKSKENEPDVLLCNYLDVYKNEFITSELNFMKATASPEQIRKLALHKGDVLITKDSEEPDDIAIPALVTEDLKGVVSGYHLALITPNSNYITGAYLFRSFQSKKINDQFVVEANGVTRFGISTYPILNSYFLLPPIPEQMRITDYLDSETKRISQIIKRIKTQIDLLDEYKKSLINNVVTGKIDVREQSESNL